jgi:hypothetical protein
MYNELKIIKLILNITVFTNNYTKNYFQSNNHGA